ncbi:MAG: hypothetical protein EOO00_09765 [Chitinophagaceae bacterium]|nr:MAG: hypothetical protein EOO00_09765 [Chitinophagaceae bacterium]
MCASNLRQLYSVTILYAQYNKDYMLPSTVGSGNNNSNNWWGVNAIGPILLGLKKPVHVLQLGSSVRSIYNMTLVSVVDAQIKSKASPSEKIGNKGAWTKFRRVSKEI